MTDLDQLLLDARPDDLPPAPVTRRHLLRLRRHIEAVPTVEGPVLDIGEPVATEVARPHRRSPVLVAALVVVIAAAGWLALRPGGTAQPTTPLPPAGGESSTTAAPSTTVAEIGPATRGSGPPVIVSDDPSFLWDLGPVGQDFEANWRRGDLIGDLLIHPGTVDDYQFLILDRSEGGSLPVTEEYIAGLDVNMAVIDGPIRRYGIWWDDGYILEFRIESASVNQLLDTMSTLKYRPDLTWEELGAPSADVATPTTAAPTTTEVILPADAGEVPPVAPVATSGQELSYTSVEFTPAGGIAATWTESGTEGFLEIRPGDEATMEETVGSLQALDPDSAILADDLPVMGRKATTIGGGSRSAVVWLKEGFLFLLMSDQAGPDELSALAQTLDIASDWKWTDWTPPDVMPEVEVLQSGSLGSTEWQMVRNRRRGSDTWCIQVKPYTAADWFCADPGTAAGAPILVVRPVASEGGMTLLAGVFGPDAVEVRWSGDRYGPASLRTLALSDGSRVLAFGVDNLVPGEQLVVEALDIDQNVIARSEFTGPLDNLHN